MTYPYTHPWLYAGVDDTAWNDDQINGGGVNEPVRIELVDTGMVPNTYIWRPIEHYDYRITGAPFVFSVAPSEFNFAVRS